jgi:hypothetical protein
MFSNLSKSKWFWSDMTLEKDFLVEQQTCSYSVHARACVTARALLEFVIEVRLGWSLLPQATR